MKIQCQSCQAKYTIADEKVLGKVVKIRCKKCGATIVINGNEMRSERPDENADTSVFDYAAQGGEPWTVNVADGDQRTLTGPEIVAEYRTGVISDETYCWKDGMTDWLPLREIEPLYGAVKLGPGRGPMESHDDISLPPQSVPPHPAAGVALFSNDSPGELDSPFSGSNGNGSYAEPVPAARRGGGRGQGADLFGNVASAGGEEDVTTSAASGGGSFQAGSAGGSMVEEQKLTGQRNESSVLFSLSALTEDKTSATNRTTAAGDGSGLIDIRALSQSMGSDDKKDTSARVDDIMNLSGGGAFGAALAAPILAPPPLEMVHDYSQGGGGKSNTGLFVAIIGGALLIAVGIVVAVVLSQPRPASVEGSTPSATAPVTPPVNSVTAEPVPAAVTATVADNTPPPPGTGNATGKPPVVTGAPAVTKPANGSAVAAPAKEPKEPTEPKPTAAAPPKDLAGALAVAAGKEKDAPAAAPQGGSSAPFDRGAAQGSLGAIANGVQSCKKPGGPTGSGHVKITFAPNGSVSAAIVDGGPFPGTPVGGCIAGKFRGAHVPAFSGGSVTVGKSFTIN